MSANMTEKTEFGYLINLSKQGALSEAELIAVRTDLETLLSHLLKDPKNPQIVCLKLGTKECWLGVDMREPTNPQIWYTDTKLQAPTPTLVKAIDHFLAVTCNVKTPHSQHFHDIDAKERLGRSLGVKSGLRAQPPIEMLQQAMSAPAKLANPQPAKPAAKTGASMFSMFKSVAANPATSQADTPEELEKKTPRPGG